MPLFGSPKLIGDPSSSPHALAYSSLPNRDLFPRNHVVQSELVTTGVLSWEAYDSCTKDTEQGLTSWPVKSTLFYDVRSTVWDQTKLFRNVVETDLRVCFTKNDQASKGTAAMIMPSTLIPLLITCRWADDNAMIGMCSWVGTDICYHYYKLGSNYTDNITYVIRAKDSIAATAHKVGCNTRQSLNRVCVYGDCKRVGNLSCL
jgi:hypothetical protein